MTPSVLIFVLYSLTLASTMLFFSATMHKISQENENQLEM